MSRGTALVTGAAKRIGRAIALELARAGYDLLVHHRDSPAEAAEVVGEAMAFGRVAVALAADLTDEAATAALVDRAAEIVGPVTLLVNSASLFANDSMSTVTAESWAAHMATNLRAPVLLAQTFAAALPAGREGAIVNVIDQRVQRLTPQFFSYTLSKAALWTATQTMAQALAPRIRVNAVGPGPTLPSVHQGAGEFDREAAAILLERRVTPEEIAAAVRFLADSPSITGQLIAVDGGQHLAWRTPDVVGD